MLYWLWRSEDVSCYSCVLSNLPSVFMVCVLWSLKCETCFTGTVLVACDSFFYHMCLQICTKFIYISMYTSTLQHFSESFNMCLTYSQVYKFSNMCNVCSYICFMCSIHTSLPVVYMYSFLKWYCFTRVLNVQLDHWTGYLKFQVWCVNLSIKFSLISISCRVL